MKGLATLQEYFADLAAKSMREPTGVLRHPYLAPAGPHDELWDWDTYFIGAALLDQGGATYLRGSVLNFLAFVGENGHTPRVIPPRGPSPMPDQCKPFLAQAALLAATALGEWEWLGPVWERLVSALRYWERKRRQRDGLFVWHNGIESGVDNNPAVWGRPALTAEGVDLASYLHREYQAAAIIARKLGRSHDAESLADSAEGLAESLNRVAWDEADGTYYNRDRRRGTAIRIATWTNFSPIWAGICPADRARYLVEEALLNDEEFWSPWGVRSLSAKEPLYNMSNIIKPLSNWQGPVWVLSNYLMMHGLRRYGYLREAEHLAGVTVAMLAGDLERTGGMHECYHAESGEGLAAPGFVGWNLLAARMPEEAESGQSVLDLPVQTPGRTKG